MKLHHLGHKLPATAASFTIALISICYLLMITWMEPQGDDLGYTLGWNRYDGRTVNYPFWAAFHYMKVNGRLANLLMPILTSWVPRFIPALLNAAVLACMYIIAISLCRFPKNTALLQVTLVSILAMALPWFDSFMLLDVMFNYVWSVTATMAVLLWVLYGNISRTTSLWACLFAVLAGWMHEACSIAACCGLAAWLLPAGRWRELTQAKRKVLIAYAIGTILVTFSPGILMRLIATRQSLPDAPMHILVAKSCFFTLLMLVLFAGMSCISTGRARLKAIWDSPMRVFIVAAIVVIPICAVGGIIYRSGWTSQIFSLIVLLHLCSSLKLKAPKWLAATLVTILVALVGISYVASAAIQHRLFAEQQKALALYNASTDGIIFMDYTREDSLTVWTMKRNKGVIDDDDTYLLQTYDRIYSYDTKRLTILPSSLKDVDLSNLNGRLWAPPGYVTNVRPALTTPTGFLVEDDTVRVVREFCLDNKILYYISPRHREPGDR